MRKVVLNLFWKWLEFDLCPPFKVTLFANYSVTKYFDLIYGPSKKTEKLSYIWIIVSLQMNVCHRLTFGKNEYKLSTHSCCWSCICIYICHTSGKSEYKACNPYKYLSLHLYLYLYNLGSKWMAACPPYLSLSLYLYLYLSYLGSKWIPSIPTGSWSRIWILSLGSPTTLCGSKISDGDGDGDNDNDNDNDNETDPRV